MMNMYIYIYIYIYIRIYSDINSRGFLGMLKVPVTLEAGLKERHIMT